jgi:hypothetical protein
MLNKRVKNLKRLRMADTLSTIFIEIPHLTKDFQFHKKRGLFLFDLNAFQQTFSSTFYTFAPLLSKYIDIQILEIHQE